jgi:endonuclease YncB( thermonuclease family)
VIRAIAATISLTIVLASCHGSSGTPTAKPAPPDLTGEEASLVRAYDGDSMKVDVDGVSVDVRLIGINAPEGDECFGDEARDALVSLVDGRTVLLVAGAGSDRDRYGRLLRYVFAGGDNVNERMLAGGYAVTLQTDHPLAAAFYETGTGASERRVGMWAAGVCGPPPPDGMTIAGVEYDPAGPDGERMNDEYVVIVNHGAGTVDLDGWILRDESSHNRYRFGRHTVEPGGAVTVRSGCGSDGGDTVFWCSDAPVWSNGGDTVILQDRSGNVATSRSYPKGG